MLPGEQHRPRQQALVESAASRLRHCKKVPEISVARGDLEERAPLPAYGDTPAAGQREPSPGERNSLSSLRQNQTMARSQAAPVLASLKAASGRDPGEKARRALRQHRAWRVGAMRGLRRVRLKKQQVSRADERTDPPVSALCHSYQDAASPCPIHTARTHKPAL